MDIGALLKSFIYLIASSLLYPVLFFLVALTLWILIYSGAFFAEWLERSRLSTCRPEEIPRLIRKPKDHRLFSHRVNHYIDNLRHTLSQKCEASDVVVENILREKTISLWKSIDRLKMIIRVGPSLGLLGTLIPMGTGLAALSQGDMTKLSTDLVIAFTTTVVGLAVGSVAYVFYTIKRRWIEEDIKNIQLATELLANDFSEGEPS